MTVLESIVEFRRGFTRGQAQRVVDVDLGFAVLDPRFGASYDHNKLIVTATASGADVAAAADRALGDAGCRHRLIEVDSDELGLALAPELVAAGYHHGINVVMRHDGSAPAEQDGVLVEVAGLEEMMQADRLGWRVSLPAASDASVEQLAARRVTRLEGGLDVTFLAVRDSAGAVVAHADLYLDRTAGVAQIEEVITAEAHRGRGLARAIMAEGRRRAEGYGVLFLEADGEDWPRHFYARIGYEPIGQSHVFTRS